MLNYVDTGDIMYILYINLETIYMAQMLVILYQVCISKLNVKYFDLILTVASTIPTWWMVFRSSPLSYGIQASTGTIASWNQ